MSPITSATVFILCLFYITNGFAGDPIFLAPATTTNNSNNNSDHNNNRNNHNTSNANQVSTLISRITPPHPPPLETRTAMNQEPPPFVQHEQIEAETILSPTSKTFQQTTKENIDTNSKHSTNASLENQMSTNEAPQRLNDDTKSASNPNNAMSSQDASEIGQIGTTEKPPLMLTMFAEFHWTEDVENQTPETFHAKEALSLTTNEPVVEVRTMVEELPPSFSNHEEDFAGPPMPPEDLQGAPFLPNSGTIVHHEQVTARHFFEAIPDESQPTASVLTLFDEVDAPGMSFEDHVIKIEGTICSTTCSMSGFPSRYSSGHGKPACGLCYCDQACVKLHNCCPDILIRNVTSHDRGQGSECVQTIATGVNLSAIQDNDLITMVTSCPDFTERSGEGSTPWEISMDLRSKCDLSDPADPQQMLPVSAKDTRVTYRNVYCAQCNGVNVSDSSNTLDPWYSKILCRSGIEKLLRGNPDTAELYRRLNSKEEVKKTGCKLKYVSEDTNLDRKCKQLLKNPIIDRCNLTGKWSYFDERIDRACNLYTSLFLNKYKNVFCYVCNIQGYIGLMGLDHIAGRTGNEAHTGRVSFKALLDFSETYISGDEAEEDGVEGEAVCKENQIYDNVTCTCRGVVCMQGKVLSPPSSPRDAPTCTAPLQSNYLGYRVCFQVDLEFKQAVHVIEDAIDNVFPVLHGQFYRPNPLVIRGTVRYWCPGDRHVTLNAEFLDFYQFGIASLLEYDKRAMTYVEGMEKYSVNWLPPGLESYKISIRTNCPSSYDKSNPCTRDGSLNVSGKEIEYPLMAGLDNILGSVHFVHFRMTNLCPHIDMPVNEFEIMDGIFIHNATRFEIESDQIDQLDDVTVRVCRDTFLGIMSSVNESNCVGNFSQSESNDFDTWTTAGLVSIVCSSLSLFCLALTFVTYVIFSSLRDASGKNIMTLTTTLFLAQAFFEFAIEQFENKMACKSFGVLIHFFWLAAVFSMNACTVERFYKLCFPLVSRAFFYSSKPFILAFVYTFASPLVIVSINILINYQTTGQIGYGSSKICYINELYSRLFAFALPLAILLLTNLILFAITVHVIRRQTIPGQKSSSTRVGIMACVQLSFVTGLTWSLAFLYEFIPFSSIGYLFTALIGLQGVLFFYSIVLNKRVIALYKGLFNSEGRGSSSGNRTGSSNCGSGGGGGVSSNDGRKGKGLSVAKRQNPIFKISFGNKRSYLFDSTQTTSIDSGDEKM